MVDVVKHRKIPQNDGNDEQ